LPATQARSDGAVIVQIISACSAPLREHLSAASARAMNVGLVWLRRAIIYQL
jgi:hypothetical protein